MSMYGMLFGQNPVTPVLLTILGNPNVGRLRDSWVEKAEDGTVRIAVYTRNGGGNREHWDEENREGAECSCTGCIISYKLPQHPLYLFDRDDDYDCTYATVYFSPPEEFIAELTAIAEEKEVDPSERWLVMLEALKTDA